MRKNREIRILYIVVIVLLVPGVSIGEGELADPVAIAEEMATESVEDSTGYCCTGSADSVCAASLQGLPPLPEDLIREKKESGSTAEEGNAITSP